MRVDRETGERKHMAKRILLVTLSLAVGLAFFNVNAVRAQSIMDGKLTGTITERQGEPLCRAWPSRSPARP